MEVIVEHPGDGIIIHAYIESARTKFIFVVTYPRKSLPPGKLRWMVHLLKNTSHNNTRENTCTNPCIMPTWRVYFVSSPFNLMSEPVGGCYAVSSVGAYTLLKGVILYLLYLLWSMHQLQAAILYLLCSFFWSYTSWRVILCISDIHFGACTSEAWFPLVKLQPVVKPHTTGQVPQGGAGGRRLSAPIMGAN